MSPIELPDPGPAETLPFRDADGASAWLARQPQAQPAQMQAALQKAVAAVDASDLPAAARLAILDRLRSAVVLAQTSLEPRYTRKPLPLPDADAEIFYAARRLWRTLAVAYLRVLPQLSGAAAALPLHRAVTALRAEHFAHLLAAYEVPVPLLRLLHGVLATADSLGVQHTALADPDYKHIAESHIAGHVAWAFLLQFADPYRLAAAQLAVANRAFSRWRELATFRMHPEDSPRGRDLPLMDILGDDGLAEGGPRWLDVRPVTRKVRNRIESLEAGETPEALKLGRELSGAACIRLLSQLDEALRPARAPVGGEKGDVALVFGAENIYGLFAGKRFGPGPGQPVQRTVDHRRMAVFGFDNQVSMSPVGVRKRIEVPTEVWQMADGYVSRRPDAGGRLSSPCLVARDYGPGQASLLGVLTGLHVGQGGRLRATLQWFSPQVQATVLPAIPENGIAARAPAFVVASAQGLSLVLPATTAVRPGQRLVIEGDEQSVVVLGQVLERGGDFVRYGAASE
ncbi:MAG TPA: hypothetical protein VFF03_18675 [Rhodocyclaceae bacterium]|nr:hypothetical protein [Rhodocyclaceae bacterium]